MPKHGTESSSCCNPLPVQPVSRTTCVQCETSVGPAHECDLLRGSLPLPGPGEWAVGHVLAYAWAA